MHFCCNLKGTSSFVITFAWNSDRGEVLTFLVIEKLQLILQEILILNFDHFMLKNGHEAVVKK